MTPRAFQFMPVILDFLRTRSNQLSATHEIREFAYPVVLKSSLTARPQAFSYALTWLTYERLIERRKRGFYIVLPQGLQPFTEDDGRRITDKYTKLNPIS